MRGWASLLVLGICAVASAQVPDVKIHLDALGTYRFENEGPSSFRYYSLFGEPSVASLRFTLEPGFTGYISQKLQRIPNDADPYPFDEAFVEDEGNWRVGKQYLPFGSGSILRESVFALRGDTTLIAEGVPIAVAIADAGTDRQQGVVGRIGPSHYGISFATGHHFGINGTSLTQIRRPEQTAGEGRGWNAVGGIDGNLLVFRRVKLGGEVVLLREGATKMDENRSIFDVNATVTQAPFEWITVGYTRETTTHRSFLRFRSSMALTDNLHLQPFVRFMDSHMWDIGFEIHVKI